MEFEQIKEFITLVDQSDLQYVSVTTDNVTLTLSKRDSADNVNVVSTPAAIETPSQVASPSEQVEKPIQTSQSVSIDSPLVGVVYLAPAPDKPAFKQVGDTVNVGDVVCIVEAMKIMNEIKSDVAGVISEVCVSNQSIVEFGQALFKVD